MKCHSIKIHVVETSHLLRRNEKSPELYRTQNIEILNWAVFDEKEKLTTNIIGIRGPTYQKDCNGKKEKKQTGQYF